VTCCPRADAYDPLTLNEESLIVLGRVLLGGFFVAAGIRHFFITPSVRAALAARGAPAPMLLLMTGTIFQIGAGLLLMAGILVRPAALGLVAFTIAASVLLLNFWSLQGAAREAAMNGWKSNLAIIGGLLVAAADGVSA
jgi:putative oxidoreductase